MSNDDLGVKSLLSWPRPDGEVLLNGKNVNYTAEIELNLYSFILNRVQELNGKMQVIIVDHANLNNDDFQSAVIKSGGMKKY